MKRIDFAELRKRLQKRAVLAVSLETQEISVAVMHGEATGPRVSAGLRLGLGAAAVLTNPEQAGAALAEELAGAKVRERRCVVCVPRQWAVSAAVEVPDVSGDDLRAFLELRAEREFSQSPAELHLTHSLFTLADGKRYATLVGVPLRRLEAVHKMMEAAGCRAVSISLGLDRSARLGANGPSLEFLANCDHVDLVVASGGGVPALRTLPGPTEQGFDAATFYREVRITLGRLPTEIRRGLDAARFAGPEESVATLMREGTDPLRRLGIPRLEAEPAGAVAHPAIDAASEFLRDRPVLFELVTRQAKAWQTALARFDARQQRLIVGAIFALVVLPLILLIVRARTESNLNEEWLRMRAEVGELESIQQRIRQFRPWYEPVPQTLQCLETLVSCFPETGDVTARNVQISDTGKVTCTGSARAQDAFFALRERVVSKPGVSAFTFQLHNDSGTARKEKEKDTPGAVRFTMTYQWEAKNAP